MNSIKKILKYTSVQTIVILVIYLLFASRLDHCYHQFLYTIGLLIKDIIVWITPFSVCIFLAHTVSSFEKNAFKFIVILIIFEFVSNFLAVWYAYGSSNIISTICSQKIIATTGAESLQALFRIPIKKPMWLSCDKGVYLGIILGFLPIPKFALNTAKKYVEIFFKNITSKLMPIFILGFVSNMYYTNVFTDVVHHYSFIFICLVIFISVYLFLIYFISQNFHLNKTLRALKNMMPAAMTAFATGCSISTMPLTIEGTSKNLRDPNLAKGIIPATTNVQQIGDCIMLCFFSCLIYKQFYGITPNIIQWVTFSIIFTLARFTVTAVIGGSIFIILPIFENYLAFNSEMIAIILALNMIVDPIVTCSNILGNGGLCIIFEKLLNKYIHKK